MILWGHNHPELPPCSRVPQLERLAAFIDAALGREEGRRLTTHLTGCEPCRRVLEEARAMLAADDRKRRRAAPFGRTRPPLPQV